MITKNHFSDVNFNSKARAWMFEDILCLADWRKGNFDLTYTNGLPLLFVKSSLRGLWKPSLGKLSSGKRFVNPCSSRNEDIDIID